MDGRIATYHQGWANTHFFSDDNRIGELSIEREHETVYYRITSEYQPRQSLRKTLSGKMDIKGPMALTTSPKRSSVKDALVNKIIEAMDDDVGEIFILKTNDKPRENTWLCLLDIDCIGLHEEVATKNLWLLRITADITTGESLANLEFVRHWALVLEYQRTASDGYKTYKRLGIAILAVEASYIFELLNVGFNQSILLQEPF